MKIHFAEPGSSRRNRTGGGPAHPHITERCKRCGVCAQICPDGALLMGEKRALVNMEYCKGCGLCARGCPFKAIEMHESK